MTPGARLQAAIVVLDDILGGAPPERALTAWSRASRYAGSRDRAAVRDIVFDALRQRRSALWRAGAEVETGRALVIGLTAPDCAGFGEGTYAPAPLSAAERAPIRDLTGATDPIRGDYPDAVAEAWATSLGAEAATVAALLRHRAPTDLRVNTLRGTVAEARAALAEDGVIVEAVAEVPGALRVLEGARRISGGQAYASGLVELQDAASQLTVHLAAPKPGDAVLDYCAGGGGKTLALAAAMGGQGRLCAHDADPRRMRDLGPRALRAGAQIDVVHPGDIPQGAFDLVFVDAPCSGSGAWRRDPAQKWRVDAGRLAELAALQDRVLDAARVYVRSGGRLAYVTCSLFSIENEDRMDALCDRWPAAHLGPTRRLLPGAPGDGFFFGEIGTR
ncbi:MAG: RsmB/NOP family class I SAM-dependent RNA methyltransferase [Pseudomonadota bacterium]